MGFSDAILYHIARRWPSPMAARVAEMGHEPGTDAYALAYARRQFESNLRRGFPVSLWDRDVLDIGCGHGGNSVYYLVAGARRVVGIDVNEASLAAAGRFAREALDRLSSSSTRVAFMRMEATRLAFGDASFDTVVADNFIEHATDLQGVLSEIRRVLRPGGELFVPTFSSIYSKYGLHLKHGLKVPWANVVFSERAIIAALGRLAKDDPRLNEWYPGLPRTPTRVRHLRKHGDLNDITYREFRSLVARLGLVLVWFRPSGVSVGRLVRRLAWARDSLLMDVFSTGAAALLRKPPDGGAPAGASAREA
jgi:SAM-dependent methyltransferase